MYLGSEAIIPIAIIISLGCAFGAYSASPQEPTYFLWE